MIRRIAGVALAALVLAGCAHRQADPFGSSSDGERGIVIEVRNLAFADATLHARRGGQRIRLGVVTGKTAETFRLDWAVSLPLRVEIDLLAGPRCVTRPLQVGPGDVVELQIEADMERDPDCTTFAPAPGGGLVYWSPPTSTTIRSATFVPVGPVTINPPAASRKG